MQVVKERDESESIRVWRRRRSW